MTKIEWVKNADGTSGQTWNPVSGCSRVSDGCKNCYAEVMTKRLAAMGQAKYQGLLNEHNRFNGAVKLDEKALLKPLSIKKPTMFFVNSMSDLFHESIPDEWIDKAFAVMALCPQHTFQILTKRPDRMKAYFHRIRKRQTDHYDIDLFMWSLFDFRQRGEIKQEAARLFDTEIPFKNIWLGVSVENQKTADERIPHLLNTPAAVRFLSCEPLLDFVDLSKWIHPPRQFRCTGNYCSFNYSKSDCEICGGTGWQWTKKKIDWVIVGGESGNKARPCYMQAIRQIVNDCQKSDVKVFVKQLGSNFCQGWNWNGEGVRYYPPIKNGKGGNIAEFPADLQIRQMPKLNGD